MPDETSITPLPPLRFAKLTSSGDHVPEAALKGLRRYRLALLVKNVTNPAYVSAQKGGDDAAARYGIEVAHFVPDIADDLVQQSALMRQIIDSRAFDGLVFTPVDPVAQIALVERANRAGLPLYNISNLVGGGEIVTFVGSDDVAIGRQMVDWLAAASGGAAKALVIEGDPKAPSAQQRREGIAIESQRHPGIELLASAPAYYHRRKATEVTKALLAAHPDADSVLAINDEMAIGACIAADAVGHRLRIIGVNGTPAGLTAVKDGRLAATVDYALYSITRRSVELAVRHLNGERLPEQRALLPTAVIDASNVDAAIAERHAWGLM